MQLSALPAQRSRERIAKDSRQDTPTGKKPAAVTKPSSTQVRLNAHGAPLGYKRDSKIARSSQREQAGKPTATQSQVSLLPQSQGSGSAVSGAQLIDHVGIGSPSRAKVREQHKEKLLLLSPRKPQVKRGGQVSSGDAQKTESKLMLLSPRKSPAKRSTGTAKPTNKPACRGTKARKMCETCEQKSANFGVAATGYRKQWCGPCGKLRGAVNPGRLEATETSTA